MIELPILNSGATTFTVIEAVETPFFSSGLSCKVGLAAERLDSFIN
jgi:hypothetical protein